MSLLVAPSTNWQRNQITLRWPISYRSGRAFPSTRMGNWSKPAPSLQKRFSWEQKQKRPQALPLRHTSPVMLLLYICRTLYSRKSMTLPRFWLMDSMWRKPCSRRWKNSWAAMWAKILRLPILPPSCWKSNLIRSAAWFWLSAVWLAASWPLRDWSTLPTWLLPTSSPAAMSLLPCRASVWPASSFAAWRSMRASTMP